MKEKIQLEHILVSIILLVTILVFFFRSSANFYMDDGMTLAKNALAAGEDATLSDVRTGFLNGLYCKDQLCELNGAMAKRLGFVDFYRNIGGIVLPNGYVAGVYEQTSTDYEIQQMIGLKQFCDKEGIELLYVNEPTKYLDDSVIEQQLGLRNYINQNVDLFLSRLDEAGIQYIDLRDNIVEEDKDSFSMFYRTDHHWTVESAKWAAEIIAKELNEDYGYHIDLDIYDDANYTYTEYKNAWLGEQGKKMSMAYVGLDDFTCIEPKFDTDYTVDTVYGTYHGTFSETMIDKNNYRSDDLETIYACPTWHYSYMRVGVNQTVIKNNNVQEGKVLVLGDSYEQVMVPFLSLGVNEVRTLVLRNYEGSLQEYIQANDIDTIVVAYAPFMIGAHDNPADVSYSMFDFH